MRDNFLFFVVMGSTILISLGKKLAQSLLKVEESALQENRRRLFKLRDLKEKLESYEHLKNLLD